MARHLGVDRGPDAYAQTCRLRMNPFLCPMSLPRSWLKCSNTVITTKTSLCQPQKRMRMTRGSELQKLESGIRGTSRGGLLGHHSMFKETELTGRFIQVRPAMINAWLILSGRSRNAVRDHLGCQLPRYQASPVSILQQSFPQPSHHLYLALFLALLCATQYVSLLLGAPLIMQ